MNYILVKTNVMVENKLKVREENQLMRTEIGYNISSVEFYCKYQDTVKLMFLR